MKIMENYGSSFLGIVICMYYIYYIQPIHQQFVNPRIVTFLATGLCLSICDYERVMIAMLVSWWF